MSETNSQAAHKIRVELSRPGEAHGEMITALEFREPTGRDVAQIGNPVKINFLSDPPSIDFDAPVMTAMLARLANVPPSTIHAVSAADWATCAYTLAGFFVPAVKTPSGSPTA